MIFGIIFFIVLLYVAYHVFALIFHWFKYGASLPLVWVALPIYLIGTGVLTLISLAALVALL
jgi:hypothetical protein